MGNNKQVKVKRQEGKAKRGLWKPEEDLILKNYVETHGEGNWAAVSKKLGMIYNQFTATCIHNFPTFRYINHCMFN